MRSFEDYRRMTEQALIPMLSSLGDIPSPLWEAMSYSLDAGGNGYGRFFCSARARWQEAIRNWRFRTHALWK